MLYNYGLENHTEMNIIYVSFEGITWIQMTQNLSGGGLLWIV